MSRSVQIPFSSAVLESVISLLTTRAEGKPSLPARAGSVAELRQLGDMVECAFYLQAKGAVGACVKAFALSVHTLVGLAPSDDRRDAVARVVMGLSPPMQLSVLHTVPLVTLLVLSTSPHLALVAWRDMLLSLFALTERDIRNIDEDCCVESRDGMVRVPLCSPPQFIEKSLTEVIEEAGVDVPGVEDGVVGAVGTAVTQSVQNVQNVQGSGGGSRDPQPDKRLLQIKLPRVPPSSPLNLVVHSEVSDSSRDFSHLLTPPVTPPSAAVQSSPPRQSSHPPHATFYLSVLRYLIIEHLLSNMASSERDMESMDGQEREEREEVERRQGGQGGQEGPLTPRQSHGSLLSEGEQTTPVVTEGETGAHPLTRSRRLLSPGSPHSNGGVENNRNIPLDTLYTLLGYLPYPYRSIRIRNAPHREALLLLQWMRYSGCFAFGCVRALDVSKCGIDASDAVSLANVVRDSPALVKLCVGNNRLGAEGLQELVKALASPTSNISAVHLEHNAIGPKGASVIASALVSCKSLASISLGYNQLGPEIEPICNALCDCRCAIVTLDVANNYIGDSGAVCLAGALGSPKCTQSLRCVRVWDPSMTSAGGDMLVDAIEHNRTLTEVGIGDSALTREARLKLGKMLRRNRGVTEASDPMAQRRRKEVDLLYGADSVFSDTWFLIDERWLAEWRDFARENSDAPPPGQITNWRLVKGDGAPIPGREKLRDYRGVCPKVYALFHSIYGGGPAIVRGKIDLYSDPVPYDIDTLLCGSG